MQIVKVATLKKGNRTKLLSLYEHHGGFRWMCGGVETTFAQPSISAACDLLANLFLNSPWRLNIE